MKFVIAESGKNAIDKMLLDANKSEKIFRVYIRRVSRWLGPVFDVALDEPKENDEIFEAEGYKILIRKEIADKISSVEIFYKDGISKSGFRVLTDMNWRHEYTYEDWVG